MGATEPAMAVTQSSREKIEKANSAFKTFKNDMRCFKEDGWKRCTSAQKRRIISAGIALTALVVAAVGGSSFALWRVSKRKKPVEKKEDDKQKEEEKKPVEKKEDDKMSANALLFAVVSGDADKVKGLLDQGANVNAEFDEYGTTPLHMVLSSSPPNKQIAKLLIERGAKLNAKAPFGMTPLHFAIREDEQEIVRLLIDKNADLNAKNNNGNDPLHFAVKEAKPEIVKILIEANADLNAKNSDGDSPLYHAFLRPYNSHHNEIAKLLIKGGANVNVEGRFGLTPLKFAVVNDNYEIAKLLIDKGATVSQSHIDEARSPQLKAFLEKKALEPNKRR